MTPPSSCSPHLFAKILQTCTGYFPATKTQSLENEWETVDLGRFLGLAKIYSRACVGVEAPQVTVEVHLTGGLPRIQIVGMPKKAVTESRDRVRAALTNSGYKFPAGAITVSLAPADLPKDGGCFDLPIALGIIAASRQVRTSALESTEFLGELSLAGELQPVRGALPAAIQARAVQHTLVLPWANGKEVARLQHGENLCASTLNEVTAWLNGSATLAPAVADPCSEFDAGPDLSEVAGQHHARRALEIAAAGGHNLLLQGPPGTGKTMLACRLPGILPPMKEDEALESAAIASVSRSGFSADNWSLRPFRAPHHTASAVALVGGGASPAPGEISLAHHGVLFLDELPEFPRRVLEVLREPLESGRILISRAANQTEFPADFQLVCAMNPCPCGYAGDLSGLCGCSAEQVGRYRQRISGPLLDRIDLHVTVQRPPTEALRPGNRYGECSSAVRERVVEARQIQNQRGALNARLDTDQIGEFCKLTEPLWALIQAAAQRYHLSPRSCHRVLRVARTIADLDGSQALSEAQLTEAIALRVPVEETPARQQIATAIQR